MRTLTSPGPIVRVTQTARGVDLQCRSGGVRLEALAVGVVRVRVAPAGRWSDPPSWDVVQADETTDHFADTADSAEHVTLAAGELCVTVERGSGRLRFADPAGHEFAADVGVWWDGAHVGASKRLAAGERHFGFGERAAGLDQTWGTKTFWNTNAREYDTRSDAMYCSIPFFISAQPNATFGCLLNSPAWARIESTLDSDEWSMVTAGRELDYIVVHGRGPAEVVERYTALTGRTPLPPRWALGYHQSRWGYDSADTLRRVSAEFAGRGLPCDVLHLDIGYMNDHEVFTWHPDRFPDPAGLVRDLYRSGRRVVAIVDPGVKVDPGNATFAGGQERDAFLRDEDGRVGHGYVWPGRCAFPDFLRPDVQSWWGDRHRMLVQAGISGIWNDMNEPAIYDRPVMGRTEPKVVELPAGVEQGPPDGRVRHVDVHNLYGLSMAKSAHDAITRFRPEERAFFLSRSGFAGIQRYAAIWTGDNTSSWAHLRMSLPMLCNLGLSGVPFVGADVGGFWHDCTPELFARWIQASVLYPLMRAHSHRDTRPNEPWAFGPDVEDIARRALSLRYQLIPYLYSLFHEAALTGAPVLRPMLWEFGDDPIAVECEDQVLLGGALLAAPVCEPQQRQRPVYLPAGRWFDWWTGASHLGPTELMAHAPLDRLPLYGRGGTAVPLDPPPESQGDDTLTLRVFPGSGTGRVYDDDGVSYAYRHGEYSLRTYEVSTGHVSTGHEATRFRLSASEGTYRRRSRKLRIEVAGGDRVDLDDDAGAIEITVPMNVDTDLPCADPG